MTLSDELRKTKYTSLTDDEAASEICATNKIEVYSRFGSYRTMASLLTSDEYNTLKAVLTAAAQSNQLVADMVEMLKIPGDEFGNGGGIDLGAGAVRACLDAFQPALTTAIVGKIKAYAERLTSTSRLNGWPDFSAWDVQIARRQING